jgi:hypothetical protein
VSDDFLGEMGIGNDTRLRYLAMAETARGADPIVVKWLTDAADEIENLRALIIAWNEAVDSGEAYVDWESAEQLRKAVGMGEEA